MTDLFALRQLPKGAGIRRCLPPALTGLIVFLACLAIVHAPFLTAAQL